MIIGITGSFGTGKTFVASIFASLGAKVVDADIIAHRVMRKGSPAHKRIEALFGVSALSKSGEIDRRKLGTIVFKDGKCLERLNRIMHPEVIREIKREINRASGHDIIVVDAPLLVEAGLIDLIDKLIVVKCSRQRQIARCVKKFRIKKEDVLKRIKRQIPLKKKLKMADFVIDNQGLKSKTRRQVLEIWRMLWR
ncbi:MAG: dephospho-CoA kinase [Candidatus Omnitrophica bacterium]|nr:dephospho-CoA kinase [Candidatus Omnitrophota bacterium]